jgi:hypothetical protein
VAGAIRIIAKGLLSRNHDNPEALGNLQSAKGIGERLVTEFLVGIPGIDSNVVKQQIANLKASGDCARIIGLPKPARAGRAPP